MHHTYKQESGALPFYRRHSIHIAANIAGAKQQKKKRKKQKVRNNEK